MEPWIVGSNPSKRYPLWTRANVGEVFPDPVAPLTFTTFMEEQTEGAWRDALVRMGGFTHDEFAPGQMETLGVFGGYCYLNASVTRILGERAPGLTAQMMDDLFFGAQPGIPPYEVAPGDQNEERTAAIGEVFQWAMTAEGPPGHLPVHGIIRHALWDAWIHERDVTVPLDLDQEQHADELAACLEYAVGLGPGLVATGQTSDHGRTGALAVVAPDPAVDLLVELGESVVVSHRPAPPGVPVLRGRAIDLIEGLSLRAPLDHDLADEHLWMISALAVAFDQAPPG